MGECLLAERERFMDLLGTERQERANLEAFASSLIQAAYKGYLLRKRLTCGVSLSPLVQPMY